MISRTASALGQHVSQLVAALRDLRFGRMTKALVCQNVRIRFGWNFAEIVVIRAEVSTLAAVVRVHVPQAQPSDRIAAACRVPVKDLGGSETVDPLLPFRCGGIVHALLVVHAAEAQSNRPVRIADVGRGAFVVLIEGIVVVRHARFRLVRMTDADRADSRDLRFR